MPLTGCACDDATVALVLGPRLANTGTGNVSTLGFMFVLAGLALLAVARRRRLAAIAATELRGPGNPEPRIER